MQVSKYNATTIENDQNILQTKKHHMISYIYLLWNFLHKAKSKSIQDSRFLIQVYIKQWVKEVHGMVSCIIRPVSHFKFPGAHTEALSSPRGYTWHLNHTICKQHSFVLLATHRQATHFHSSRYPLLMCSHDQQYVMGSLPDIFTIPNSGSCTQSPYISHTCSL